ncbi:DUF4244 domain-containing protein [Streptomyces sp. NPDC049906]|uniref:DUF4244 domain-containing protein n=1 Tax=Streptomyces sp. NPDC049906 TaxID=3155656 RepID=UPI0034412F2F
MDEEHTTSTGRSPARTAARARARTRSGTPTSPRSGAARSRANTDRGVVTSEYAVGLIAAVGFAGVLYKVVTSDRVSAALYGLVERALDAAP